MNKVFNPLYISHDLVLFYTYLFVIVLIIVLTIIFVIKEVKRR